MKKDKYYKDLEEKGYYDNLDKRTKDYREYKEWKAKFNEENKVGLGDVVESVTKATGIKKVVDTVSKALDTDCGCDERKEKFNKFTLWSKKGVNCISEDDYKWYVENEIARKSRLDFSDVRRFITIYNSVFNTNVKPTKCSSCLNSYRRKLNEYIEIYNS